jgi:uncharacterized protein (TIGR02588 family)
MPAKRQTSSSQRKPAAAPEIPLAEWIAGGIGLLLVTFTVGFMLYSALTRGDAPPDVRVELLSVTPVSDGFVAKFRAANHGDHAASQVHIFGAHGEGSAREESEAVLDFLAAHSHKGGGLFFRREPSRDTLSLRATGYQEP